jgi:hypothetical protein
MRPRESSHGAANEIRVCDQSEHSKGDRLDDSAERAGAGGQGDSMNVVSKSAFGFALAAVLVVLCASAHAQPRGFHGCMDP